MRGAAAFAGALRHDEALARHCDGRAHHHRAVECHHAGTIGAMTDGMIGETIGTVSDLHVGAGLTLGSPILTLFPSPPSRAT